MKKFALLLACLAMAPVAMASQQDVRLRFGMSFAGIPIGEVVETLRFSEDGFSIESVGTPASLVEAIGVPGINRSSVGKVGDDGSLLMEEFREARGDKVREAKVDRATGEVSWLSDKGVAGSGASEGVQVLNSLTVIYTPYSTGSLKAEGSALMATGRRLYVFDYGTEKQEEKLEVDAGEFEVWRQSRLNDPRGRQLSVWFAPEL